MSLVAGIDPGANGAIAVYDTASRSIVSVEDMPFWYQSVGKKQRKRIDPLALAELFEGLQVLGVDLVVMEAVGGRPRQSASSAFAFGYGVGLIYSCCMYSKLMIETVPPAKWKKLMNIPGKRGGKEQKKQIEGMNDGKEKNVAKRVAAKQAEGDIINRADQLFPGSRAMFSTQRGAYRMDRAEAAMLAKFGGDFVLATMPSLGDVEFKLAYRNADTGA